MAFEVLITVSAETDLDAITNYIAIDLANPIAAAKFLDKVTTLIGTLSETPLIFPLHSDPCLRKMSYRCAGVMNYLSVFRIEKHRVYILRFFHQTQNYTEYL